MASRGTPRRRAWRNWWKVERLVRRCGGMVVMAVSVGCVTEVVAVADGVEED